MPVLVPAVYATDVACVRDMLSRDPDCADQLDMSGETALHHAVHNLCEKLELFYGGDQSDQDSSKMNTVENEVEIVVLIANALKKTRPLLDRKKNMPLIELARALKRTEGPHPDLTDVFDSITTPKNINAVDERKRTVLIKAVLVEDWNLVRHLVKNHKPDLRHKSPTAVQLEYENMLMEKRYIMDNALHRALFFNAPLDVLDLLITEDTVNDTDGKGDTPLHIACEKGNVDAIALLVNKGANVNLVEEGHISALRWYFVNNTYLDDIDLLEKMTPDEPAIIYHVVQAILFRDTPARQEHAQSTEASIRMLLSHIKSFPLENLSMRASTVLPFLFRVIFRGITEQGWVNVNNMYDLRQLEINIQLLLEIGCEFTQYPDPITPWLEVHELTNAKCWEPAVVIERLLELHKHRKKRMPKLVTLALAVVKRHINSRSRADVHSQLQLPKELQYLVDNGPLADVLISKWKKLE